MRKSRRAASRGVVSALVLIALVLVVLMARMGRGDGSGPASVDELIGFWMIGWFCGLVWWNARWLTVPSPVRAARRRRTRDSVLRAPYEVELFEEGLTSRTDGLATQVSWSYFAEVVETKREFVLTRHSGDADFALPKRGLPDAAQVNTLRDFLHVHIARPS